jgi:tyrosyl-tRNA synthetase
MKWKGGQGSQVTQPPRELWLTHDTDGTAMLLIIIHSKTVIITKLAAKAPDMACRVLQSLQRQGVMQACSHPRLDTLLTSAKSSSVYAGFDPTASSLHVGNLAVMVCLAKLQSFGFRPLWLVRAAFCLLRC